MSNIAFWTPEHDNTLLSMRANNKSYHVIALRIGRSYEACRTRFKVLRARGAVSVPTKRVAPVTGDACCDPALIIKASARFVADGLRIYGAQA